jgi:hypothetical protein
MNASTQDPEHQRRYPQPWVSTQSVMAQHPDMEWHSKGSFEFKLAGRRKEGWEERTGH